MKPIRFTVMYRSSAGSRISAVRRGQARGKTILGVIFLILAAGIAWVTDGFHAEKDLSNYPEITLTYTDCRYERIVHSKGGTTRQVVFTAANGRYVMEDGVWRGHFAGPDLARAFGGTGTVRAWVHPRFPHALRGIAGGKVEIPPNWGLEYDQRNMRMGLCMDIVLMLVGTFLVCL